MTKAKVKKPHFDRMAWVKSRTVKRPGRTKMLSGFCGNAHCEGTKPRSPSGLAVKTCPLYLTCPCKCHAEIDEMFRIAEEDRILIENPEYVPPDNGVLRKMLEEIRQEAAQLRRIESNGESSLPNVLDPDINDEEILSGKAFRPTISGIRARGQLEYQVFAMCVEAWKEWPEGLPITPKIVAEFISAHENLQPPSTGAIQAVWIRWENMNFASFNKKPVEFTGFVDYERGSAPSFSDLERTKVNHKSAVRRGAAESRRNIIRGQRK